MVRPANFGYNDETAESNAFQEQLPLPDREIQSKAVGEFDEFIKILKSNGVGVFTINDSTKPVKTDAIFPNNWISTHSDGTINLYPLYSASRREERKNGVIDLLNKHFIVSAFNDFTYKEADHCFLEGTGSMVLDRVNKRAFACLSNRTDQHLFSRISAYLHYEPIAFHAVDLNGIPIYHTNVMMSIGTSHAVICSESIEDEKERKKVVQTLRQTDHSVVEITQHQMACFAGNMLEVRTRDGEKLIILSKTAFESLNREQINTLQEHGRLIPISIPIIEKIGGGSVRCMMTEIFLTPHETARNDA